MNAAIRGSNGKTIWRQQSRVMSVDRFEAKLLDNWFIYYFYAFRH